MKSVNHRSAATLAVILFLACLPGAIRAETATEALESARLWGETERATMEVTLEIDTGRGEKSRTLEVYVDNQNDESKLFAQVTVPPFLSRMKYLYLRAPNGSETKWVSTSRGVRQLSNAQRTEKLFDSDFTTEDLSQLVVEQFVVTYLDGSDGDGDEIVVRAEPKDGSTATRLITIDRETRIITQVEYLDDAGKTERVYRVEETETIDGILTVSLCSMTDTDAGTKTLLSVESFDPSSSIPPRVFSRASL